MRVLVLQCVIARPPNLAMDYTETDARNTRLDLDIEPGFEVLEGQPVYNGAAADGGPPIVKLTPNFI